MCRCISVFYWKCEGNRFGENIILNCWVTNPVIILVEIFERTSPIRTYNLQTLDQRSHTHMSELTELLSEHRTFYFGPLFGKPSISTTVKTTGFLFWPDISTTQYSDNISQLSKHWHVETMICRNIEITPHHHQRQ